MRTPWRRLLAYFGGWLLAFCLLLGPFQWEAMHALDLRLARALQSDDVRLDPDLLVVDVPADGGTTAFRQRLADLLQRLSAGDEVPQAVGLDVWSANETPAEASLARAIAALSARNVRIVGALNVHADNRDGVDLDFGRRHLMSLYSLMDGVGHNLIQNPEDRQNWPFYRPCDLAGSGLRAMPVLLSDSPLCDEQPASVRRIPLGAPMRQAHAGQMLRFDAACAFGWRAYREDLPGQAGECLAAALPLRGRRLIVGSFAADRSPYDRPGPEIVAWATSDLLRNRAPGLLNEVWLHLGLALAMALFALLLFIGLLRFIRRWRLTPWRIAGVAGGVTLLWPLLLIGLLRLIGGPDFSQVLLPTLTMVLTLLLATHYRTRRLGQPAAGDYDFTAYDVFVSYRHSQQPWVEQTLRPLLAGLSRDDGQPLQIFVDAEGIRSGQDWAKRLANVIYEARIFLAVLTPDYFQANAKGACVCRWEMEHALQRHASDPRFLILPLAHAGYDASQHTPADLRHLPSKQMLSSDDPDLKDRLKLAFDAAFAAMPPAIAANSTNS